MFGIPSYKDMPCYLLLTISATSKPANKTRLMRNGKKEEMNVEVDEGGDKERKSGTLNHLSKVPEAPVYINVNSFVILFPSLSGGGPAG